MRKNQKSIPRRTIKKLPCAVPKKKKRPVDYLKLVCWILVPVLIAALLVLDAFGIYIFSTERLTVLGIGLLIILLPFFSEIKLKDLSVKREKSQNKK